MENGMNMETVYGERKWLESRSHEIEYIASHEGIGAGHGSLQLRETS